jgi:hypothetical protein
VEIPAIARAAAAASGARTFRFMVTPWIDG